MFDLFFTSLILTVPFVLGFLPASLKEWLITLGTVIPALFGLNYLAMPVMAWDNAFLWVAGSVMFAVGAFINFASGYNRNADIWGAGVIRKVTLTFFVTAILAIIYTSTPLFNAVEHASVLDIREETKIFDPSSVLMDPEQARFVDMDLAQRATKEKLGEKVGLGTRTKIRESRIQSVGGELLWVSPLTHKNMFKYLANDEVDGYITVSASKFSDTDAVLDQSIVYGTEGFYFSKNVKRHLYMNGYHDTYLTDYTLELSDSGKPFWVVSKYDRTIGTSGKKVTGVVIVDAKTGEFTDLSIDELAEKAPWVDRVQPESIVMDQVDSWGKFSKGIKNYLFVGDEVLNPTEGLSLVYTKDGRSMWYTGMQSGHGQEGTVGFVLVDTKTGEATFYRRTGITESVAKRAIEGKVQEYGYKASNPIPYNVNGVSTFIAVLKDDKGNPQMVGVVAYNDRSVLAVGPNLETAMRRYQLAQSQSSSDMSLGKTRDQVSINGVLGRVGFQQVDNHASLHFTLKDDAESRVFTVSGMDSARYILSRPGDAVKISYIDTGSDPILVHSFENEAL